MAYVFPVYQLGQDTPGAPVIPDAVPAYPYVPAPESGYHHWQFGVNADSLAPYGSLGTTLNAQAGGQTYSSNYVTLPSYSNGLLSNVADARIQSIYAVVKYQPVASKIVLLVGNISVLTGGAGVWIDQSGQIQTVVRNAGSIALINQGVPDADAGDWIFVGLSKSDDGSVAATKTIVGATIYSGNTWDARQSVAANNVGAGNTLYNSATYTPAPLSIAELLIKPTAADDTDKMLTLYWHAKARSAARGITVR